MRLRLLLLSTFLLLPISTVRAQEVDIPTLSLLIRTSLNLGNYDIAKNELIDLESRAIYKDSNNIAWGKDEVWDAFSDSTTNPADTLYSYTTSMAALAFQDAFTVLGDPYYDLVAHRASHALITKMCCYQTSKYFSVWYSSSSYDKKMGYQVPNVTALAMAVMLRNKEKVDYTYRTLRYLRDLQRPSGNWLYSLNQTKENDLGHESYIIYGLQLAKSTSQVNKAKDQIFKQYLNPITIPYNRYLPIYLSVENNIPLKSAVEDQCSVIDSLSGLGGWCSFSLSSII